MADGRYIVGTALLLTAFLATASSQSCPVSGQSRVNCATPPPCQPTCASANSVITCTAVCVDNGCQCPRDTFINEETNACVQDVGCAKLWCGLPVDTGGCGRANASSMARYFFNSSSGQCQLFDYEGCVAGNGNNFMTLQECQDTCRCTLPSDPGPCEAYFEMYFYNVTTARCEMFVYGGCQGNDNRFTTMELCQQACRGDVSHGAVVRFQWQTVSLLLLSSVLMMLALM